MSFVFCSTCMYLSDANHPFQYLMLCKEHILNYGLSRLEISPTFYKKLNKQCASEAFPLNLIQLLVGVPVSIGPENPNP